VCNGVDENAHGLNHRYSQDIPAFPAQWFYGFLRALPGERPLLPPLCETEIPHGAPASRRQDHTTSPYAESVLVRRDQKSRLTLATSIASRAQRVVTIAIRPSLSERETGESLKMFCPTAKAKNFCQRGWTFGLREKRGSDLPVGQEPAWLTCRTVCSG